MCLSFPQWRKMRRLPGVNHELLIRKLIKATVGRAYREVTACVFILMFFSVSLAHLRPGSLRFDGCVTLLATAVLIAGVVLKYTLSEKLLRRHPAGETAFWQRVFVSQARLLRLVPLWYLTPLCAGVLLYSFPGGSAHNEGWIGKFIFLALAFAVLTWFNRVAAIRLEHEARSLGRLRPHKPRLWLQSKNRATSHRQPRSPVAITVHARRPAL